MGIVPNFPGFYGPEQNIQDNQAPGGGKGGKQQDCGLWEPSKLGLSREGGGAAV